MGEMDRAPTALITGVSRGLGKELARQYAADGWKVIGTERHELEMTDCQQIRQFATISLMDHVRKRLLELPPG